MEHENLPACFVVDAPPWTYMGIREGELESRVEMTADECVVDGQHYFIRGHIEIPVHGFPEPLAFSVWSSLSEESFEHMADRWEDADRDTDPPCFGWLISSIPVYPDTVHLKLSVQSRKPGLTPLFTVEPTAHPLAIDQHHGISIARWQELAHRILHGGS